MAVTYPVQLQLCIWHASRSRCALTLREAQDASARAAIVAELTAQGVFVYDLTEERRELCTAVAARYRQEGVGPERFLRDPLCILNTLR